MDLSAKIEAILFFKSEPVSLKFLANALEVTEKDIELALEQLGQSLAGRGVTLMTKGEEVMLGTAPVASTLIENLIKEELSKDLGKAGLETLAIIIYEGPISRPEIDYIRGVNSSFILRNLLVRGLVERLPKPGDSRTFIYGPSFDLLRYLGVSQVENLPEFATIRQELIDFKNKRETLNQADGNPDHPTN
jgi:segregation and condensation protein B